LKLAHLGLKNFFFAYPFLSDFLDAKKNAKNSKKVKGSGRSAQCAGPAEGLGRCKTLCKSLHAAENHAKNFAKGFMQTVGRIQHAAQGAGGLKTLARDRPHPRWLAMRMGLPSVSPRSLCLIFGKVLQHFSLHFGPIEMNFAIDCLSIFV
jgi:hypothetical protein